MTCKYSSIKFRKNKVSAEHIFTDGNVYLKKFDDH